MARAVKCKGCGEEHDPLRACPVRGKVAKRVGVGLEGRVQWLEVTMEVLEREVARLGEVSGSGESREKRNRRQAAYMRERRAAARAGVSLEEWRARGGKGGVKSRGRRGV